MKRYLHVAVLISLVLTLTAFASNTQSEQNQNAQHIKASRSSQPMSDCQQGTNCDSSTQLRQMASEGGPMPICRPGTGCDPNTQLRVNSGRSTGMKPTSSKEDARLVLAELS